jgi:hypothetical protein
MIRSDATQRSAQMRLRTEYSCVKRTDDSNAKDVCDIAPSAVLLGAGLCGGREGADWRYLRGWNAEMLGVGCGVAMGGCGFEVGRYHIRRVRIDV